MNPDEMNKIMQEEDPALENIMGTNEPADEPPEDETEIKTYPGQGAFEWLDVVTTCLAAVILVFLFVIKSFTVAGTSMLPTFSSGAGVLVSSISKIEIGDVVVIDRDTEREKSLIKRVIATEGMTVDLNSYTGEITVDGSPIFYDPADLTDNIRGDQTYPLTVPEGCVFVLGDNRSVSYDSRYTAVGCMPVEEIIGEVVFVYHPASQFGFFKG